MKLPVERYAVVNDLGEPAGSRTRGELLSAGEYYLVVHVWVRDEVGGYLVQKRAAHLRSHPGVWATTVGYVLDGEESIDAAVRETQEELGVRLPPHRLTRLGSGVVGGRLEDRWIGMVPRSDLGSPRMGDEVADWKWASKAELQQLASEGDFFQYSYLDELPG